MSTFGNLKQVEPWKGRSTGFSKIYAAMERNDSPEPNFETDEEKTYFLATLPIHPDVQTEEQDRGQAGGQAPKKDLNDTERAIMKALEEGPSSRSNLLDALGMEKRTRYFRRVLEGLMESGLIEYRYPETPRHPDQAYKITNLGKQQVES